MNTSQHESTTGVDRDRVLVVDDEPKLAELYERWLEGRYEVTVTTSGRAALEEVDERTDVVLLDRDMPETSGFDILREIRERDYDCATAMITAVEPDVDIIDMGFDEYILKPIRQGPLLELVAGLAARVEYEEMRRRSYQLASKKAVLETAKDRGRLERNEEYQQLVRELEAVQSELQHNLEELLEWNSDASVLFRGLDDARSDRTVAPHLS